MQMCGGRFGGRLCQPAAGMRLTSRVRIRFWTRMALAIDANLFHGGSHFNPNSAW